MSETMVLYALVFQTEADGTRRFLVRMDGGKPTFPPTKLRGREDLYVALDRIFEGDFGLPRKRFYPECELAPIANAPEGPRYEGLPERWLLYPVLVSLTPDALALFSPEYSRRYEPAAAEPQPSSRSCRDGTLRSRNEPADADPNRSRLVAPAVLDCAGASWLTLDELAAATDEPNTHAIITFLRSEGAKKMLEKAPSAPSMDARANYWARFHDGGVRIVRGETLKGILASGDRAFNLRVADPYLPYHRQGLGFTWSFFTPKDRQDLHVHGLPAVEIYGVLEGRLQLWWKPMNARGVRVWKNRILEAGDWAEVEPLHCHFAAWLTPEGLGTVIKAAGSGELAGVGRLGVSGKTVCDWSDPEDDERKRKSRHCSNHGYCAIPPAMQLLMAEYAKDFSARDYTRIRSLA